MWMGKKKKKKKKKNQVENFESRYTQDKYVY